MEQKGTRAHADATGEIVHRNLLELVEFPEDGISTEVLFKSEDFSTALICLGKGHRVEEHRSTGRTCIQIIEGSGRLFFGEGRSLDLKRGDNVSIPEGITRSFLAHENLAMLLCLEHLLTPEMYRARRSKETQRKGC